MVTFSSELCVELICGKCQTLGFNWATAFLTLVAHHHELPEAEAQTLFMSG